MSNKTLTLGQAAAWCGGQIAPELEERPFFGANFDSRLIRPGELFAALPGARDGHDFAASALERGAAAVLASRPVDGPAIYVEDTSRALRDIARGYRESLPCRCVGITGSVGKTTTKEMIAAVLRTALRTQWTEKNYNNEIGLPVSVLRLKPDCEAAVLEMGMNHFGELSVLTRIAQPDLAVITNIGTMHIENLGSREGILRAKLEILEGLRPGGRVIFNGDDALLRPLSGTWYWLAIRGALFLLPLAVCLVLALVFRKKLAARRERDPIDPKWRRLFFRTPGWIIFLVLSCVCIILNFFVLGA